MTELNLWISVTVQVPEPGMSGPERKSVSRSGVHRGMVPGPLGAPATAGDRRLHLAEVQRPLGFSVAHRNRRVTGQPQESVPVGPEPQDPGGGRDAGTRDRWPRWRHSAVRSGRPSPQPRSHHRSRPDPGTPTSDGRRRDPARCSAWCNPTARGRARPRRLRPASAAPCP